MEKITLSSNSKLSALFWLLVFSISLLMPSEAYSQILPGFTDGDCYSNNPDLQSSATNRDGELDWEDVYNGNLQIVYPNSISTGIQFDDGTTEPDRSFIGGNTKDHIDLSSWQNQAGTSSDKSDIGQGGAVLIDGIIYFFGNRLSSEGTTNIGFWLFQQDVQSLDGSFSGIHEVGDILIVVEVTNGGAIGTVNAFKWVGANNGTIPQSTKTLIELSTSNTTLNAYRNANHEATPWPHQAKNDPTPNNQPPVTFFEGFIDIATLNLAETCFSSFLVETRSSSVVTSVLEDYLGGGFNVQPEVTIDDITECAENFPVDLVANVNGGLSPLTFEWKKDGVTMENEVSSTISVNDAGTYSVIAIGTGIGGSGNCNSESDSAIITKVSSPAPSVDDESVCDGDTATFSTVDLGDGFTYQWYLNDEAIDGATSNEYTTSALSLNEDGDIYKVIVTDTNNPTSCTGDDSGTLSVKTNPVPSVDDESVCAGDTATFSTVDLGDGFTYQWYLNDELIAGATSNEYTTSALSLNEDGDIYKVIVTDTNNPTSCTGDDSGTLSVKTNPAPSVDDESVCDGDTATFSTVDLGDGFTYQWYLNDELIAGATSNEYTTSALSLNEDGDIYKVIVTDTNNPTSCTGDDSGTLSVKTNPAPSVDDESVCDGDTATFSTVDLGDGFTYQWYLNDELIAGATSNEYTTAALTLAEDGNVYKVMVTDTNNPTSCTGDDSGTLSVNSNPVVEIEQPQLTCLGERPSVAITSQTNDLEFRLVIKGQSGSFLDYSEPYTNLDYNTTYVLTAKSKTGPTFCETDHEFTTPVELDIPSSVALMVNSPTCESYDGSTYFGGIQVTNHIAGYTYAVVVQSTFVDIESVPLSAYVNYDSTSGLISNVETGSYYVIAKSPDGCLSAIAPAILMSPDCLTCETAFAKNTASADGMDSSYCFITQSPFDNNEDVLNSERWGWTNEYTQSEYVTWTASDPLVLNLYAAAGQCDISKGALAGYVEVYFVGDRDTGAGSFKVEYISNESESGWLIEGAQFYIGEDPYPKNGKGKNADEYTVAPGKYPFTIDTDATNHVILDALECKGVDKLYIIAHADVCTANSIEYKEQLWTAAETEFFDIGRKNNTIVYGNISKGGKPKTSSTSTSLTETSDPLFSVAPVPFRDVLNIGYLFDYTSDVTIQVFDLNGRLLATYKDSAVNSASISSFNVDFRTKSNQIYIVRMTTDREIYSAKIIAAK